MCMTAPMLGAFAGNTAGICPAFAKETQADFKYAKFGCFVGTSA